MREIESGCSIRRGEGGNVTGEQIGVTAVTRPWGARYPAGVIEQLLVLRCDGGNWEIRVVTRRDAWWKRWLRAWREDREALRLAELDERTVKDIGLEQCAGSFAARVHAYREQELRRLAMARLGLM